MGLEKEEEEDARYVAENILQGGYAKRWLVIFEDGVLSYSMDPESNSRGAIDVPHASVSSDIRHGMIFVSELTLRYNSCGQWRQCFPYVLRGSANLTRFKDAQ